MDRSTRHASTSKLARPQPTKFKNVVCKLFVTLLGFGYCLLAMQTAEATSFQAKNFSALVQEADEIVIGTVVAISARRTAAREIVTDYRLDELEIITGTVRGGSLTLTLLGGTVGTDSLTVAGAPKFEHGVRYLLFVVGNGAVMFPLVGGHQGVFQMRKDLVSGEMRVHDYAGRALSRLPGVAVKATVDPARSEPREPLTEKAFVDAIRADLAKKGAG